jgi:hypothetical protein
MASFYTKKLFHMAAFGRFGEKEVVVSRGSKKDGQAKVRKGLFLRPFQCQSGQSTQYTKVHCLEICFAESQLLPEGFWTVHGPSSSCVHWILPEMSCLLLEETPVVFPFPSFGPLS